MENDSLDLILDRLDKLDKRMAKMETYLERQKGFIGAILLVGSGLAWLATYLKDIFK